MKNATIITILAHTFESEIKDMFCDYPSLDNYSDLSLYKVICLAYTNNDKAMKSALSDAFTYSDGVRALAWVLESTEWNGEEIDYREAFESLDSWAICEICQTGIRKAIEEVGYINFESSRDIYDSQLYKALAKVGENLIDNILL